MGWQEFDASSSQFNSQREAIEAHTNLGECCSIGRGHIKGWDMCLGALDKESNRSKVCDGFLVKTLFQIRQCQWGNGDALFTAKAKGNATGNEYFHVRTGPQQDLKRWSRLDNLLEIV